MGWLTPFLKGAREALFDFDLNRVDARFIRRNAASKETPFKSRPADKLGKNHGFVATESGTVYTCRAPTVDALRRNPRPERQLSILNSALEVCMSDHEFRQKNRRPIDSTKSALAVNTPNSKRVIEKFTYDVRSFMLFYLEVLTDTLPRIKKQIDFVVNGVNRDIQRKARSLETDEDKRKLDTIKADFEEKYANPIYELYEKVHKASKAAYDESKEVYSKVVSRSPGTERDVRKLSFGVEESKDRK